MRIAVTGGSGFIGSHVVDRVHAHGHDVVNFDLTASAWHSPQSIETVTADICDGAAARRALRRCDSVIHLAAVADVSDVVADPVRANRVNVQGTQTILEAARDLGVRVIYGSTVWVYGNSQAEEPLDEYAQLALPTHLYTATKIAGEMYCRSYAELYGGGHTILRFGIPYGPRARAAAVVAAFANRAQQGKALTIAGDGRQTRQFVYVEELAEGIVRVAGAEAAAGKIFNLVGDERTSVRQIADTVRAVVAPVPIVHGPERPADVHIGHVSAVRAATELGWRAATPFAEGVGRYVEWPRQITSWSLNAGGANWSPDGSKIVFQSYRDCSCSETSQAYMVAPDGSGLRQLTNAGRNIEPNWSPDGKKIIYAHQPGTAPGQLPDLWAMDASGKNKMPVVQTKLWESEPDRGTAPPAR